MSWYQRLIVFQDEDFVAEKDDAGSPTDDSEAEEPDASDDDDDGAAEEDEDEDDEEMVSCDVVYEWFRLIWQEI